MNIGKLIKPFSRVGYLNKTQTTVLIGGIAVASIAAIMLCTSSGKAAVKKIRAHFTGTNLEELKKDTSPLLHKPQPYPSKRPKSDIKSFKQPLNIGAIPSKAWFKGFAVMAITSR